MLKIKYGYCHCGCNQKTNTYRGKPYKYIHGHNGAKSISKYLVSKTKKYKRTYCWIWQRSKNNYGYGQMRVGDKMLLAHRVYYERFVGKIPKDLELDHLCRNRACVNPKHLESVTARENQRRGLRGILWKPKPYCIHGHKMTKKNTYVYGNNTQCKECKRLQHMERRKTCIRT